MSETERPETAAATAAGTPPSPAKAGASAGHAHVHGPDCNHDHDHGHDLDPNLLLNRQPHYRTEPKIGRNDPCPCGSGKKHKKCHGA